MSSIMQAGQIVLLWYEVIELIGLGGQGAVARGVDTRTGEAVAIKQLLASPGTPNYDRILARFRREAQVSVSHPNVVEYLDLGEDGGTWFAIMRFEEGQDLAHIMAANGGKLPADQAVAITMAVAEGLQACHNMGLVHRDLKPANILIRPDGSPCILDLGICRNTNEHTITTDDGLLGTLGYMSPEQIRSPRTVDARSDLYSLGVILYEMLTGLPAAPGQNTEEVLRSIRDHTPPSPTDLDPSIPEHISLACMQLLAKDPAARFPNCTEFIQAMQGACAPVPASSCGSCGAQLLADAIYCHDCGAHVARTHEEAPRCLACGAPVTDAAICVSCQRPFGPLGHKLTFHSGSLMGLTFMIPGGIYAVGRDELSPRDQQLSRRHFLMACIDGVLYVQDGGSTNRTYVDNLFADRPVPLVPGREFRVAGSSAAYTVDCLKGAW
ncbi:protein kinase [Planctomycetota bacterium]